MGFEEGHKNIPEELVTSYSLDGKKITLTGKTGKPKKYRNPEYIDQEKKIEACALYTVVGDIKLVAEKTHLTEKQVRDMRDEPWWAEVQKRIMVEQNEGLLATVNKTVTAALTELEDRLTNGDVIHKDAKYSKDGDLLEEAHDIRTPIKARDLAQIFHAVSHQRNLMRGDPTQITQASTTEEKLKLLRNHFKEFAQLTVVEGTATVLEDKTEKDGSNQ